MVYRSSESPRRLRQSKQHLARSCVQNLFCFLGPAVIITVHTLQISLALRPIILTHWRAQFWRGTKFRRLALQWRAILFDLRILLPT